MDKAIHFPTAPDALAACKQYQLENVELVLHFGTDSRDVTLPICEG